jgi:hypothetical protein
LTDKVWSDAIRIAVNEAFEGGDRKKMRVIAEKLVSEALNGNLAAIKEIGDRLDSRPAQTIQATVDSSVHVVSEDEMAKADRLLEMAVKTQKSPVVH